MIRLNRTSRVAAGALLAAIAMVVFNGPHNDADPTAPIRALGRALEISERSIRNLAVDATRPRHGATLVVGVTLRGATAPR